MLKKLIPAVLSTLVLSTFAFAGDEGSNQDFTLWNDTGFTIGSVYVSLANDDSWGEDVLGEDMLPVGESTTIRFSGYKPKDCIFDIKIKKGEDGPEFTVEDVNLCKLDNLTFYSKGKKVFYKKH
jgi:hypothetical protein